MSKLVRKRRQRRQLKQFLKYGKKAKPKHASVSGRTGSIFTKQLRSRGK